MRAGRVALGLAALLAVAWVAAAPYITVYRMKAAAENRDGEALSEHIDFTSVRQSLKDQLNALFAKKLTESKDLKDNPLAALGAAFAGVLVDKVVDAYVTSAGITQLMAGEKPQPGSKPAPPGGKPGEAPSGGPAGPGGPAGAGGGSGGTGAGGSGPEGAERKPLADATMSYESLDKFVVRAKGKDGTEGRFVLRRRGLGWQLTEIILPAS